MKEEELEEELYEDKKVLITDKDVIFGSSTYEMGSVLGAVVHQEEAWGKSTYSGCLGMIAFGSVILYVALHSSKTTGTTTCLAIAGALLIAFPIAYFLWGSILYPYDLKIYTIENANKGKINVTEVVNETGRTVRYEGAGVRERIVLRSRDNEYLHKLASIINEHKPKLGGAL